jgi:hypothetical protein
LGVLPLIQPRTACMILLTSQLHPELNLLKDSDIKDNSK